MFLVTGGAGFVGSHGADALAASGAPVRIVDREPPRDDLPDGVEHGVGDVRDPAAVREALRGVDAVCHQAAMVGLGPEDAPADPRNVSAATKLHQEHLAAAFSRETGVPVTALRYHNVYGPRMPRDTPYAGVAALFAGALSAGTAPRVFEDGGQLRDFVHVRDVARANVLALTAADPVPGAFNVCSGTPRSVLDLARALHAASAPEAPAARGGRRLPARRRPACLRRPDARHDRPRLHGARELRRGAARAVGRAGVGVSAERCERGSVDRPEGHVR